MIQCKDCEFFRRNEAGEIAFACDPFSNVKEPECLAKWQLLKINQLVNSYQAQLEYYHKLAPLQEKMFKVVQRETRRHERIRKVESRRRGGRAFRGRKRRKQG